MSKIILHICIMSVIIQTATGMAAVYGQLITATRSWSALNLVYYRDFPYIRDDSDQPTAGCHLVPEKKKNGHRVLRCTEHVKLLIPTAMASVWQKEQKQLGYINLYAKKIMAGYASLGMQAHIISIKPIKLNPEKFTHAKNTHPVTALFIRHERCVKKYKFKNMETGIINTVNATANHPFYVKNKKKFLPLNRITASDTLLTDTGQPVRLICHKRSKKHCGTPYRKCKTTTVYNIETYPNHTYFVGKNYPVLVHNCSAITAPPESAANPTDRVENKIPADIPDHNLPPHMLVRLMELPAVERIKQEHWIPLKYIQELDRQKTTDQLLSPFTGNKVVRIKDSYGNEIGIEYLQLIGQHSNGGLTAPDPVKMAEIKKIYHDIKFYSVKIRRISSDYDAYKNDQLMQDIIRKQRETKINEYQEKIARKRKRLSVLGVGENLK